MLRKLMDKLGRVWGRGKKQMLAGILAAVLFGTVARADDPKPASPAPAIDQSLQGLKIGILAFIDYTEGDSALPDGQVRHYNQFGLTRGYFTVEKKITGRLGARMTLDLLQDREDKIKLDTDGDGVTEEYKVADDMEGNYVMRLKYLYAVIAPADWGPFTQMKAEIGMGHMPWLDFEESMNPYRAQGTMAVERAGVFASADVGVSLMGNLGGALANAEQKTGSAKYDGRYGSWHLGVYNGGGYAAVEKNQNKVVEGRVSLRPLAEALPGLQVSYFYLTGQGNASAQYRQDTYWPYYAANIGMVSFEHPNVVFTGQYLAGRGNAKGAWTYHDKRDALAWNGWSTFLMLRQDKWAMFGRHDVFDIDAEDKILEDGEGGYALTIVGISYSPLPGHLLILDWEGCEYQNDAGGRGSLPVRDNNLGHERKLQLVYQLKI